MNWISVMILSTLLYSTLGVAELPMARPIPPTTAEIPPPVMPFPMAPPVANFPAPTQPIPTAPKPATRKIVCGSYKWIKVDQKSVTIEQQGNQQYKASCSSTEAENQAKADVERCLDREAANCQRPKSEGGDGGEYLPESETEALHFNAYLLGNNTNLPIAGWPVMCVAYYSVTARCKLPQN